MRCSSLTVATHGIWLCIMLACLCAGRAGATETLDCTAGELVLMVHVGSEGPADLQVFVNERERYGYGRDDLDTAEFDWATSEKPFSGNRMELIKKASSGVLPAMCIVVQGEKGELLFQGRRYDVECDWRY